MNTKSIIILGVVGLVVYFFVIKPATQPKPAGVAGVVSDIGKLIGDFSGQPA